MSRTLECKQTTINTFHTRNHTFTFCKRFDLSNPLIRTAFSMAFFKDLVDFYEREYREGSRPRLTTSLLDDIGLVGVSGEFFAAHSLFFFQAEDGIRDGTVTGVQTCALPI